jgi:hypothetical protein
MTNVLRYALHSLSPKVLLELQEQYPNASIQIELSEQPVRGGLSESAFWQLIDRLDWSQKGNDAAVIEPVVFVLSHAPMRHIHDFADILSHKLYLLDGEQFANLESDTSFDADQFLYTRCCVVANGKAFFDNIRQNSTKMPHDLIFAALLRVPNLAYQRKVGKPLNYVWAYPIETFGNAAAWSQFDLEKQEL